MARALALYSGGLDSALAILVMLRLGIQVTAVTFQTGFGCNQADSFRRAARATADRFGFDLIVSDITPQFLDIVKRPHFGYGKNMNPCLDCKILMLREAKKLMAETGADFVVTGEVPGQRPMSQRKHMLPVIDREAGLTGMIVRPLSARLMSPTIPEQNGLLEREMLFRIHGRSRKPQVALAAELGLDDYQQPAGGCLLTDSAYAERLRRLLQENPSATVRDILLLRVGRHFRLSDDAKAIIGRDERDNAALGELLSSSDYRLFMKDCGSPLTTIVGDPSAAALRTAAALTARYSAARMLPTVSVTVEKDGMQNTLDVTPAADDQVDRLRD